LLRPVVWQKFTDVSFITLVKEAASTSETSVNFYTTAWRNNPEDSHLHTGSLENMKSH
jgi:hypothetical protein